MKLLSIVVLLVVVAIALGQIESTREPRHHGHRGHERPHNGTLGSGDGRNGTLEHGHEGRGRGDHGRRHHGSTAAPAVAAGKR
uniref:Uncharacterized protein n=1 Tax=Acrobeloides nanus TaxID=290746 RepID=A0A914DKQ0_9BILA